MCAFRGVFVLLVRNRRLPPLAFGSHGMSFGYLGIVVFTLVLAGPAAARESLGPDSQMTISKWLIISKPWITPLQAPVGIVLGVMFASSQPKPEAGETSEAGAAAPTPGGEPAPPASH